MYEIFNTNIAKTRYYFHSVKTKTRCFLNKKKKFFDENLFNINLFQAKARSAAPLWMKKIIDQEFEPFFSKKISQKSLEATFRRVIPAHLSQDHHVIHRFRIIDHRLYVFREPREYNFDYDPLPILLKIVKDSGLSEFTHADFLISYADGMPLPKMFSNYWISEKIEDQAPILTPAKLDDAPFLICIPERFTAQHWPLASKKIQLANQIHPWNRKKKVAFWRGGIADFHLPPLPVLPEHIVEGALNSARFRLSCLSKSIPEIIDAGFTKNRFFLPNKTTRMLKPFIKKPKTMKQHLAYAYLPTLDGVCCTYPGYLWRLLSNSVVFKQEAGTRQWFYDSLKPYEHYIPIKKDLSDLIAQIEWAKKNDKKCIEISKNANNLVKQNLMIEDIYLYYYFLIQKYISCQDFDKDALKKDTFGNDFWTRL